MLHAVDGGEKVLPLLERGLNDLLPGQLDAGLSDERTVLEDRTCGDGLGIAGTAQIRTDGRDLTLGEQALQRLPLGDALRVGQRIFAEAAQVFARHRAGELHARLALLIRQIAQGADRGDRNAADDQQHHRDIDGRAPYPERRPGDVDLQAIEELLDAVDHEEAHMRKLNGSLLNVCVFPFAIRRAT